MPDLPQGLLPAGGIHQLELVADDLASLALDAEMEEKEFARSGINPLMLPLWPRPALRKAPSRSPPLAGKGCAC